MPPVPPVVKEGAKKIVAIIFNKLKDQKFIRDKANDINREQDPDAIANHSLFVTLTNPKHVQDKINAFLAKYGRLPTKADAPLIDIPPMWLRDP